MFEKVQNLNYQFFVDDLCHLVDYYYYLIDARYYLIENYYCLIDFYYCFVEFYLYFVDFDRSQFFLHPSHLTLFPPFLIHPN